MQAGGYNAVQQRGGACKVGSFTSPEIWEGFQGEVEAKGSQNSLSLQSSLHTFVNHFRDPEDSDCRRRSVKSSWLSHCER